MSLVRASWLVLFMLAVSCAVNRRKTDARSEINLYESYWKLIELNNNVIDTVGHKEREAHLIFNISDSRVTGSGGCNRFSGIYEINGHQIRISQIISTKMACMNVPYEIDFFNAIQKADKFLISDDTLKLSSDNVTFAKFILRRNSEK